jgi:hypothetical protein
MKSLTYQDVVDRLVAVGVLPAERADAAWQSLSGWARPDQQVDTDDLLMALVDIGVAVQVHGEDCEVELAYRSILQDAAALSGGAVVVTDVALDTDGPGDGRLTFRVNGQPRSWYEDHRDPEYIDKMAVIEQISDLAPGGDDPRSFYGILADEPGEDDFFFLLTPEQATALHDEFGLGLEEV